MHDLAVNGLIAFAVVGAVMCTVGVLVSRSALDRLHYAQAATAVPPFVIAAAVAVENGFTQPTLNAIVVAVLVLILGATAGHATARAAGREKRR